MPGYIGYTPQFEPISLQEYLTVPNMVLAEYKEAEKEYNEAQDKAAALESLLGERTQDNEAGWNIVDRYNNLISTATNAIADRGVRNADAYIQARNARRYYRENMLPLEAGIPAFQEDLKKYDSDPTMIGDRPTLDTYIKNPLHKGRMVSGSIIQSEAMKAAAAASARRKQETPKTGSIANGQYISISNPVGFSPDEVMAWLNDSNSSPELKQLEDDIANKYGIYDQDKVKQYIKRGILDGIAYDNKTTYHSNKAWDLQAKKDLMNYKARLAGQDNRSNGNDVLIKRPTVQNQTKDQERLANKIDRFNELLQEIEKNPEILDAKEPKRFNDTELNNIAGKDPSKQAALAISNPNLKNQNYQKELRTYNKRKEFERLIKEIGVTVNNNYPNQKIDFNFTTYDEDVPVNLPGIGAGTKKVKRLRYDSNLLDVLDNLATKTRGYNYNVTPSMMQAITNDIAINTGVYSNKKENDKIYDEHGNKAKNSKLKEVNWDQVQIYIDGGENKFDWNGHTYTLKPGALGAIDEFFFNSGKRIDDLGREFDYIGLTDLYNSGEYGLYNQGINKYANTLVDLYRNKVQGQPGTTTKPQELGGFFDDLEFGEE